MNRQSNNFLYRLRLAVGMLLIGAFLGLLTILPIWPLALLLIATYGFVVGIDLGILDGLLCTLALNLGIGSINYLSTVHISTTSNIVVLGLMTFTVGYLFGSCFGKLKL